MSTQSRAHSALSVPRVALPVLFILAIAVILEFFGPVASVDQKSGSFARTHSLSSRLSNTGHTDKTESRPTVLTISPANLGQKFALGAVGLSVETAQLATQHMRANHKSLIALLRLLGPGVLRVGGNTLDYSWWTSDGEPSPAWATSVITPSDLIDLRRLLTAVNWRVILGVDLGHFDPTRAAAEASAAEHILGSRLLGIEIGNEPRSYGTPLINLRGSTYNVSTYLEEVSAYTMAIHAISPSIPLYGPELSAPSSWLTPIASDAQAPFSVLTEHYYPTSYGVSKGICTSTPTPTALDLLSPQIRQEENTLLGTLVTAGQIAHRETRISETNTTSSCDKGGGRATSPVFASALWSLDWVLRAASAGVAGLNFHGSFGVCTPVTYSPICSPSNAAEARGQVIARPEYYGLLAARQLEGGRFVPVYTGGQNASAELTAYATVHSHSVITLAVDNFSTEDSATVMLKVSGYAKATREFLVGPSVSATSGVTFGHAFVNADGVLRTVSTKISGTDGVFTLKLRPTTAALITLYR
jgi:hypothetical protein